MVCRFFGKFCHHLSPLILFFKKLLQVSNKCLKLKLKFPFFNQLAGRSKRKHIKLKGIMDIDHSNIVNLYYIFRYLEPLDLIAQIEIDRCTQELETTVTMQKDQ